jgi:hypothetical protein
VLEVTELDSELIEGWKINLLFFISFFVYYTDTRNKQKAVYYTDIQPTQTTVYYTKRRHGKYRILYETKEIILLVYWYNTICILYEKEQKNKITETTENLYIIPTEKRQKKTVYYTEWQKIL